MSININVLSPLESLNECRFNEKELVTTYLDNELSYASQAIFVVPLTEAADTYINRSVKSTSSYDLSFYKFD